MIEYLPHLLLAWSIQLSGVVSPGPSVALILGIATAEGRRPALITVCGIGCGSFVLATATVLGLTALFAEIAGLMTVIRFLGAAYLAWLAWGAFRRAASPPPLRVAEVGSASLLQRMAMGFLLQATNPKAMLFYVAIASVGGLAGAPIEVAVIFVVGCFVNSVLGHAVWALVLSAARVRRAYLSAQRWVEGALGVFFAFAAFRLATARS